MICPITREIMKEPVYLGDTKHIFEKDAIMQHLKNKKTDPLTNLPLKGNEVELTPAEYMKQDIIKYHKIAAKLENMNTDEITQKHKQAIKDGEKNLKKLEKEFQDHLLKLNGMYEVEQGKKWFEYHSSKLGSKCYVIEIPNAQAYSQTTQTVKARKGSDNDANDDEKNGTNNNGKKDKNEEFKVVMKENNQFIEELRVDAKKLITKYTDDTKKEILKMCENTLNDLDENEQDTHDNIDQQADDAKSRFEMLCDKSRRRCREFGNWVKEGVRLLIEKATRFYKMALATLGGASVTSATTGLLHVFSMSPCWVSWLAGILGVTSTAACACGIGIAAIVGALIGLLIYYLHKKWKGSRQTLN